LDGGTELTVTHQCKTGQSLSSARFRLRRK
jgi:hypothetical protein